MKPYVIIVFLLFVISCATIPPPQGQTSKASYVGDYYTTQLSDIIVSVPTGNNNVPHENLHLSFSALINPKDASLASKYDVGGIVRRFYERLASIIVEEVLNYGRVTIQELPTLRNNVVEKAQAEFDQMFSKWSHAIDFDVEIVLTSIYLTDGSVGRSVRPSRW